MSTIKREYQCKFCISGIQQENRHIRQLQHENKELRAALEEHQNAVELIMSKYRQHMSYLVHTTKLDKNLINQQRAKVRISTDKICRKCRSRLSVAFYIIHP